MKLVRTDYIGRKRYKDLKELIDCCNEQDHTHYGMTEDADLYHLLYDEDKQLVSAIAVFFMGDLYEGLEIREIAAFTRPDKRRQHLFSELLESLREELEETAVRFAVYDNETALLVLKKLSAKHDHDELMMTVSLDGFEDTDCSDLKLMIDFADEKVSTDYGECYFRDFGDAIYIYGVLTFDNFKRKGYAKRMLRQLFAVMRKEGKANALLQVSSENIPAVRLYEGLGMQESDRLCYYYYTL